MGLKRNYLNYPLALGELLLKILAPPCLLAEFGLRVALLPAGWILRFGLIYPTATFVYWSLRNAYTDWSNAREAARRGAVLPPRISGKWPGSLDIALELEKEVVTGYVAYELRRFFKESGSNTVAIRILWQDIVRGHLHLKLRTDSYTQILTQDEVHSRHVLANGFQHWIKGDTTKYIMCATPQFLHGASDLASQGKRFWQQHA